MRGRISALIELGAGFHPEISGRENVFINGIMLGLTKREIQQRFDEIVEFAELREFIDAPVKTYSSGHVHAARLCGGDPRRSRSPARRRGAGRRRRRLHAQVPRQVRASSSGAARRSCSSRTRSASSSGSATRRSGSTTARNGPRAIPSASSAPTSPTSSGRRSSSWPRRTPRRSTTPAAAARPQGPVDAGDSVADMSRAGEGRWGSGGVEIADVRLQNEQGQPTHVFHTGEPLTVRLSSSSGSADRTTSCSASASSTPKACACTARTRTSKSIEARHARRRRRSDARHRGPRSRRRHLQARRRRPQARWRALRLPPPAVHVPRQVAVEGRRHLPAAPPLGVFGRREASSRASDDRSRWTPPRTSADRERQAGRRIVFTNGVFDLAASWSRPLPARRARRGRRADRRPQLGSVGAGDQRAVTPDHART